MCAKERNRRLSSSVYRCHLRTADCFGSESTKMEVVRRRENAPEEQSAFSFSFAFGSKRCANNLMEVVRRRENAPEEQSAPRKLRKRIRHSIQMSREQNCARLCVCIRHRVTAFKKKSRISCGLDYKSHVRQLLFGDARDCHVRTEIYQHEIT